MIGVVTKNLENSQLWFKMPEPMNRPLQPLLALATNHSPIRIVTRFDNLRSPSMLISGFVLLRELFKNSDCRARTPSIDSVNRLATASICHMYRLAKRADFWEFSDFGDFTSSWGRSTTISVRFAT